MREFKFRDVQKHNETGRISFYYYTLEDVWNEDSWQGKLPFKVIATEQYTGLKDSYKTEAYQGDKISAYTYDNWIIVWHNNGWMLKQDDIENYKPIPEQFVIIGNIHEDSN